MTQIATQVLDHAGLVPTLRAAVNTDTIAGDGRTVLWIVNGGATTLTIGATPLAGQAAGPKVVLAPAAQGFVGPFPAGVFGPTPLVDYGAGAVLTSVTVAALAFGTGRVVPDNAY